jgi:hypothetical protein
MFVVDRVELKLLDEVTLIVHFEHEDALVLENRVHAVHQGVEIIRMGKDVVRRDDPGTTELLANLSLRSCC